MRLPDQLTAPAPAFPAELAELAAGTRGFMPEAEGLALYAAGYAAAGHGPLLEVGSYCGKSALYLGAAARARGSVLVTVDHHRGSEENQAGWEHHDPSVVDPVSGRMDTLPFLRRTLEAAELEDVVVTVVGRSATVAGLWSAPLSLVFVDGGHGTTEAHTDYECWAPKVAPGGLLAIHDVFENPADGGRPPFEIYQRALASGAFAEVSATGSLRVLARVDGDPV